jgi:hypothetical protein
MVPKYRNRKLEGYILSNSPGTLGAIAKQLFTVLVSDFN